MLNVGHDSPPRVTLMADLNIWSGYGLILTQLFTGLVRMGYFVSVRPIMVDKSFGSRIPVELKAAVVHRPQAEKWEVLIHPPDMTPTPGKRTIYFTMWESSTLAPKYVETLNKADHVVVPCEWNRRCFAESGVTKPIHVLPLGFDPDVFKPSPIRADGPCVFGVAGRPSHGAKRKGVRASIETFLRAFPVEQDVRLHVKAHQDCDIGDIPDPRIIVSRKLMTPHEIAQWLRQLTAFVSLARAEGFGLWQLQALACGRPVIAAKYSGLADFLPDDFSLAFTEVSADGEDSDANVDYRGKWCEPSEEHAALAMRSIYDYHQKHNALLQVLSDAAATSVRDFTWQRSTQLMANLLQNVGAVP